MALPLLSTLLPWWQTNLPAEEALELVVPEDERPDDLGVDAEMLLLVLPDNFEPLLPELAASNIFEYNRVSEDLMACHTLLAFRSASVWVEVDAWDSSFSPSVEEGKFYVGLLAGDRFVLALHDYGSEDMEAFLVGMQACCIASGPNYRPYRSWSQEEIDAAARGERQPTAPYWEEPSRRVGCCSVRFD